MRTFPALKRVVSIGRGAGSADLCRDRSKPAVRSIQQRLWPDPQPLVQRLGRSFFLGLPSAPGVYLMHGTADAVLYVGKAKNLRRRLASYRVANPERMAQRTLRLLRLVERIGWEECADEAAAVRREAELLLTLEPRFNRAGVWQGPARFLAWRSQAGGFELAVVESVADGWDCAGPFGAAAIYLHRALVRLLWCRFHPQAGLAEMPAGWFHGGHGPRVQFSHDDGALIEEARDRLAQLANGRCDSFQEWLLPAKSPFEQSMREADLELVTKSRLRRVIE